MNAGVSGRSLLGLGLGVLFGATGCTSRGVESGAGSDGAATDAAGAETTGDGTDRGTTGEGGTTGTDGSSGGQEPPDPPEVCMPSPTPVCGDGVVQGDEPCDGGGTMTELCADDCERPGFAPGPVVGLWSRGIEILDDGSLIVVAGEPQRGREVVRIDPSGEILWRADLDVGDADRAEASRLALTASTIFVAGHLVDTDRTLVGALWRFSHEGEPFEPVLDAPGPLGPIVARRDGGLYGLAEQHGVGPKLRTYVQGRDAEGSPSWSSEVVVDGHEHGPSLSAITETSEGTLFAVGRTGGADPLERQMVVVLVADEEPLIVLHHTDDSQVWWYDLDATPDGGAVAAGTFGGAPWVVAFDRDGQELWSSTCEGHGTTSAHTVHVGANGAVIVGGGYEPSCVGDVCPGEMFPWVRHYSPNGTLLANDIGFDLLAPDRAFVTALALDPEGVPIAAGDVDDPYERRLWTSRLAPAP